MKVLWICNFMLPSIAKKHGKKATNKEGWIVGLSEKLGQLDKAELSLTVCFPVMPGEELLEGTIVDDSKISFSYYAYPENSNRLECYQPETEERLYRIFQEEAPDVIHIFGTEYPHALAALNAAKRLQSEDKILVGIQGYMSKCADCYYADLPPKVINRATLRDRLKKDSIVLQKEKFEKRARMERKLLEGISHITGRTDFDRETVRYHEPEATYHFLNETLRSPFYSGRWNPSDCGAYTIFVSQGNYPIKGAHKAIQAVGELKEEFPGIRLVIAGDNITSKKTLKDRVKLSSYGKYLLELVRRYRLEKQVVFTGPLNAEQMKQQYLNSFVFLSCSAIENSPNSVGEAMLLGMPVISSDVGGVRSILSDNEGYLYSFEDVKDLKVQIRNVFRNREEAAERGARARERARKTHDGDTNYHRLLEIYREIAKCGD